MNIRYLIVVTAILSNSCLKAELDNPITRRQAAFERERQLLEREHDALHDVKARSLIKAYNENELYLAYEQKEEDKENKKIDWASKRIIGIMYLSIRDNNERYTDNVGDFIELLDHLRRENKLENPNKSIGRVVNVPFGYKLVIREDNTLHLQESNR